MLIVTAINITEEDGERVIAARTGRADYLVEVAVNSQPPIWKGEVKGHLRARGAAALLHRIANKMKQG